MPYRYQQILGVPQAVGISRSAVKIALEQIADEMLPRMQKLCPVKTGALRDSIRIKTVAGGSDPRMEVSTKSYGFFQDEDPGWRPFVKPVIEQAQWALKFARYVRTIMRARNTKLTAALRN